jgi:KDO2-lipid IV(A) lauroyltransferase
MSDASADAPPRPAPAPATPPGRALPPAPLAPRHWPGWIGVALGVLAGRLPWVLQRGLGQAFGVLLARLPISRRRVAERNLALCFPGLDDAARAALLRASMRALGVGVFEFARAWWGGVGALRAGASIEGLEHIEAVRASGRGVILVSGHFTTLESSARLLAERLPVAGMYRPHAAGPMEYAVKRGRLRYACAMFTRDELRPAVKHLKDGGILWFAPDQDTRRGDSVFVPFFGLPAWSLTSTHQLARLSGAAVIPFFHRREGARHVLRIAPPLDGFPSRDATADTERVIGAIEAMVREAPSQYLWIHKRFKRRPEGEAPLY